MLRRRPRWDPVWLELRFSTATDSDQVAGLARMMVSERRRIPVVFEVSSTHGAIRYRLGVPRHEAHRFERMLLAALPGTTAEAIERVVAEEGSAWKVVTRPRHPMLRVGEAHTLMRMLLAVLRDARDPVVIQMVLGPRVPAEHFPVPTSTRMPAGVLDQVRGTAPADSRAQEIARSVRDKRSEPGVRAVLRLAIGNTDRRNSRRLAREILAVYRSIEPPAVRIELRPASYRSVVDASAGWTWPLALNVLEVAAVVAWPAHAGKVPGLDQHRTMPLPPVDRVPDRGRVIAASAYPGTDRPLALDADDALQHLHVLGPTGAGKSTLLLRLIAEDMAQGRGVVVVEPKGDLIDDVLARVPDDRLGDVVLLDPSDSDTVVGLNPLGTVGEAPELVASRMLAVFTGLEADSLGPRMFEVLHAALLTLTRAAGQMTLVDLPLLLGDEAYRRTVVGSLDDRLGLGGFWAWFERLSEPERDQVVAPVMRRVRRLIVDPRLRRTFGQTDTAFDMSEVFTRRRIVLVAASRGRLGYEAAGLLGAVAVSQLWAAAQARVQVPARKRRPAFLYLDEFQDFLHLPTDVADVLAQARGLGLGLIGAHQHLAQLPSSTRQAVLANTRSKVAFALGSEDAAIMARHTSDVSAESFTALGRYEAYINLMADGEQSGWMSARTLPPPETSSVPQAVRAASRRRYGRPVATVDAELEKRTAPGRTASSPVGRRPRRSP